MLSVLVGGVIYLKKNRWLGLALLITGFWEMIWWTCPELLYGASVEADRSLVNKFCFSLASFVLLLVLVWFISLLGEDGGKPEMEREPHCRIRC